MAESGPTHAAEGVPHELIIRKKAGHGWADMTNDYTLFADWFEKHLAAKNN